MSGDAARRPRVVPRGATSEIPRGTLGVVEEPVTDFDLVVIGSGAAGMMAAVVASEETGVALVTDRGLGTSNSAVAQGGLQFPAPGSAATATFKADMLSSGGASVDEARVDHFVAAVRDVVVLLEQWGLELDRDDDGRLRRLSAGGLSEPRLVTAGERIGPAILKVLRRRVQASAVEVFTGEAVESIEIDADGRFLVSTSRNRFNARVVVVATGGRSFEYARELGLETSNPANGNGSMRRMLVRLGLSERDPEEFQFHPYGIVGPDGAATGKTVPESIVSLGGFVGDRTGRRLVDPRADRAAVVAAMRSCLHDGHGVEVGDAAACRLVMHSVDEAELAARYPHLERQIGGARLSGGDIPVRPVVHYQLGGFDVAPDGSTAIDGLFLAGEITGGLHGRNRLMGNGITEAVVDGWTAGRAACAWLRSSAVTPLD